VGLLVLLTLVQVNVHWSVLVNAQVSPLDVVVARAGRLISFPVMVPLVAARCVPNPCCHSTPSTFRSVVVLDMTAAATSWLMLLNSSDGVAEHAELPN
jgi:hypothetical protein